MSKRREAILVLIAEANGKCIVPKGYNEAAYNKGVEDALTYVINGLKKIHW